MLPSTLASATVKRRIVALKLCIDETGQVSRSIVVTSSGNRNIDRYYQDQVSRWTLKPVMQGQKPRGSVANISVTWNVQ
jgi:TonB family protein